MIIGGDGARGWGDVHLSKRGYAVSIVDNLCRRQMDDQLGFNSLSPIKGIHERVRRWKEVSGKRHPALKSATSATTSSLGAAFKKFEPTACVHFGEQRSAPYSMMDRTRAVFTQTNNVMGTINVLLRHRRSLPPSATSSSSAPWVSTAPRILTSKRVTSPSPTTAAPTPCRTRSKAVRSTTCPSATTLPTCCSAPRPGTCATTDLNQGVVYGLSTDETDMHPDLVNRLDYDAVFGTALNRFCIQAAVGHPMTVSTARVVKLAVS